MLAQTYIYILMIIALFLLLNIVDRSTYIEKNTNRFYKCAIVVNMFALGGFVGRIIAEYNHIVWLSVLVNIVIYCACPAIGYCVALSYMSITRRTKIILGIPFLIEVILTLCSPVTGWMFIVNKGVLYERGPLYPLLFIEVMIYVIVWILASNREFANVDFKEKVHLMCLYALTVFAFLVQAIDAPIKTGYIGIALVLLLYYAFLIETSGKYDELTGIKNRKAFYGVAEYLRSNDEYAIIFYDANGLKKANDNLGHEKGDDLIKTSVEAIETCIGKQGTVYRMGGDEFCAIIRSADVDVIEKINRDIANYLDVKSKEKGFEISISAGYAIHRIGDENDYTVIMKRADKAMYDNKQEYYKNRNNE